MMISFLVNTVTHISTLQNKNRDLSDYIYFEIEMFFHSQDI
jgi:hypothetical protein